MPLSSFALIMGVYCYIFGFPLVFTDDQHLQWRKKILKDENVLRLIGTAWVMVAVTMLRHHWKMTADAEGIVILTAWFVFCKSVFMAWWPRYFCQIAGRVEEFLFESSSVQVFVGFIVVLLGALFTFLGLVLI